MKKIPALFLTLTLLFSIGMALAQDGAATPEEAVEKYNQAILNLDADAAIPYTQWSDQVTEAVMKGIGQESKETRVQMMMMGSIPHDEWEYGNEQEAKKRKEEWLKRSDEEIDSVLRANWLYGANCMKQVLAEAKARGGISKLERKEPTKTVPSVPQGEAVAYSLSYEEGYLEFQQFLLPGAMDLRAESLDKDSLDSVMKNVQILSAEASMESIAFCCQGRWYVFDPSDWLFYMD